MEYYKSKYHYGNATYVEAVLMDEPYADVSINIENVSENLPENQIVVNHDLYALRETEEYKTIAKDLFKKVVGPIRYGYAESIIVELVDNWKDICKDYENYFQMV